MVAVVAARAENHLPITVGAVEQAAEVPASRRSMRTGSTPAKSRTILCMLGRAGHGSGGAAPAVAAAKQTGAGAASFSPARV